MNETKLKTESKTVKIQGILTSNLRSRTSTDVPYMAFIKLEWEYETRNNKQWNHQHSLEECARYKCQECEIPVIFRVSEEYLIKTFGTVKINLKKGYRINLEGKFSESEKSNRASFTCYAYQILSERKFSENLGKSSDQLVSNYD